MKLTFDLTPEIKLQPVWKKFYRIIQVFLYLFFTIFLVYIAREILFPVYDFNYVSGTTGLSNNIINPHPTKSNDSESQYVFNINQPGDLTSAEVNISMPKNSTDLKGSSLEVQKSFQAFFYPTGKKLGFKDGSLVFDGNNYYLISNGEKRKFSSLNIAQAFGLSQQSFSKVTPDDLRYNGQGEDISDSRSLIDDLIFHVGNTYYQVRAGQLWAFTSEKAYLSQYNKAQAINQDEQFLSDQTISENAIGYADGTPASIGQSVVILSNGKYYPIDNPITFNGLGWNWDDVVPIGSDELALYSRQKQFTFSDQHPDGTIFADNESGNYYMLSNNQKLLIPTAAILDSYLKRKPVVVSSKSLTIKTTPCLLKKSIWPRDSYYCRISLSNIDQLPGNDFQFTLSSDQSISPSALHVKLYSPINWKSAKQTLAGVRDSLQYNYSNQQ